MKNEIITLFIIEAIMAIIVMIFHLQTNDFNIDTYYIVSGIIFFLWALMMIGSRIIRYLDSSLNDDVY